MKKVPTMYHGTALEFDVFEFDDVGWFVDNLKQAWCYAFESLNAVGGKPRVIEVNLRSGNRHNVTPKEMKEWSRESDKDFLSRMKAKGYDSLVFPDIYAGVDIVVFDPSQVEIVRVHKKIPKEFL